MDKHYVIINKNTLRKFKAEQVIMDADNSVGFVSVEDFISMFGEMPDDEKTYSMVTWPDSEMYQEHEEYNEKAYETEDGVMVPLAWEQFIPFVLIDRMED